MGTQYLLGIYMGHVDEQILRENRMVDRCMRKDSLSCDPSRITAGVTTRVHPHAPINHTVFFLCHGFIKFMYINKILMKTRIYIFYISCYNVNYFVSQPVGLDFTSGSGLLVGLDMKTPCTRLPAVSCDLNTIMA